MKLKVAALLLSPMMVHAQAKPALPQRALALYSSVAIPTPLTHASASAADVPDTSPAKISTGVTAPKLIKTVPIVEDSVSAEGIIKGYREATVSMIVDESGKPTKVEILESAGPSMDRNILQAVKQYRYRPATVSGEVCSIPLRLHINIEEPGE